MRWLAAVLVCALVCSVKSQEEEEEPFLKIMANPTIVYNVRETKAIFCNSSIEPIEWYSPSGTKVGRKSVSNVRVTIEKKNPSLGVPLIIRDLTLKDSGNWTCKAGDLSASIDIFVGEKVVIKEKHVNIEGDEDKSVKMTCEANGHPKPVVTWHKDSKPIKSDNKKYFIKSDHTLEIRKLTHMDAGIYVCKVRQKALSHYTDKSYHLSVKHKPILYKTSTEMLTSQKYKTEEVYAILNETKNVTCNALAYPPPTYHWNRREDGEDGPEITDPDMVFHSEDGNYSVLMLRMQNESVLGEYVCSAKNIKGSESVVFHVTLGTKPDPPDFVAIVSATASEIVFNVSCSTCPMLSEDDIAPNPENLTITGYTFELVPYQENYVPDWDTAFHQEVDIKDPNSTLFKVEGLNNKTKYHVRVGTINAAGYSEWFYLTALAETGNAYRLATTSLLIAFAVLLSLCY